MKKSKVQTVFQKLEKLSVKELLDVSEKIKVLVLNAHNITNSNHIESCHTAYSHGHKELTYAEKVLVDNTHFVPAVKCIIERTGLGLVESKRLMDSYRNSGRNAIGEMKSTTPETFNGLNNREKDLINQGRLVEAIKHLRERCGLSLRDAHFEVDKWRSK